MADNTKLLLLAGAGAAVWYFYFRTPADVGSGPAAPSGSTGGAPAAGGGGSTTTTPATNPPATAKPTLSAIQAKTIAAAPAGQKLSIDEWDWYANNVLAANGLPATPDPMPLFSAAYAATGAPRPFDRSTLLTSDEYFTVMGPALKASPYGLSGFGLGMYLRTR